MLGLLFPLFICGTPNHTSKRVSYVWLLPVAYNLVYFVFYEPALMPSLCLLFAVITFTRATLIYRDHSTAREAFIL